jgi:antitoxin (DNA-binding transcriptional repressor) of toxin-antitoxin stability system
MAEVSAQVGGYSGPQVCGLVGISYRQLDYWARQDLGTELASANLVLTGTSSVLARTNGEVVDLLAGGQGVFNIVPLAGVVEELDADIVRLDTARADGKAKRAPERARVARASGE